MESIEYAVSCFSLSFDNLAGQNLTITPASVNVRNRMKQQTFVFTKGHHPVPAGPVARQRGGVGM